MTGYYCFSLRPQAVGRRRCRRRDRRRRRAGRRAVDDQHRHGRYRRDRRAGRGACPRRLGARAHHRRPRRERRRRAAASASGSRGSASTCRWSATSTISATSCSPIIRPAPRRSPNTASIPAMSASRTRRTSSSPTIIEMAIRYDKPVRIGVNWGSLDQELLTRLMDENQTAGSPLTAREVTREAIVQSALLSADAGRRDRPAARPDHPVGQGQPGAGPDRRLYRCLRTPLRPCAASRPDRGRHGLEGHRRLVGGDGHPAAAGHRRHDPRLADAGAERRPHPRGAGGAGTAADHGLPPVRADRRRLPRLRPHHLDGVPGAGAEHPGRPPHATCRCGARNIPASRRSRSR